MAENKRGPLRGPAESRRQALSGTNSISGRRRVSRTLGDNPLENILERLQGVRRSGKGFIARCPGHQDRHPSLNIAEGRDGRVLLHCFVGCEPEAIVNAVGLRLTDLFADAPFHHFPPPRRHPVPRRVAQALLGRPNFAYEWELVKILARVPEPLAQRDLLLSWDFLADRVDIPFLVAMARVVREARA